jgi:hypothetical protein
VPPGTGGAIPNLLAPAGGTIGANTGAVVDPLSALLFGG